MTDIQHDNYSIIPHIGEPRFLLLERDSGWTLPQHHATQAADINKAMKEQLGLAVTVLYCAYDRYKDDEREHQHRVYALENHSPGETPREGRWVGHEDLSNLALVIPEH